jgi:DNA-binding NarL/FixJ family response regulator
MESPLTEQEIVVLNAFANGCQDAQDVADELSVSKRTVQTHLQNARRKTDTHSTTALLALAFRSGWLSPNGE